MKLWEGELLEQGEPMSLAETIMEIAQEMESEEQLTDHAPTLLKLYAKELRRVIKAAGDSPRGKPILTSSHLDPDFLDKCREEFRGRHAQITSFEEKQAKGYIACGGPYDGDTVQGPPYMPVGARTQQDGVIYQLEADGLLHFISMAQ